MRSTTPSRSSMPTARVLGTYRKAHIPESPGYHEKFYFSPGDTGFKVWRTRFGTIGVGDLLGPMVSGIGARDGAARRGDPVLSDRDRLGAAGSEHRFARSLAARDAGARGVEHHAAGGVESHRHRAGRALESDLLRLIVHHRSHRRDRQAGRSHAARRCSPRRSISTRSATIATPGACSAIAGRSCTARS